jgi:hypothetical protein
MPMMTLVGALVVAAAGLIMGSGVWPFKLMRTYQFEHWWFIGMLVGLVVMPWTITLLGCPNAFQALQNVPASAILLGNLFALGWGIANILCGLCYVRIGVALTGAILAGLGVSVGSIIPLVFKGSGLFRDSADLRSPAGITVLVGVGVMLVGVVMASLAGFGRDRALAKAEEKSGGFLGGLIMTVIAGVLSSFMAFAFVYSQGPIVAQFSEVQPGSEVTVAVRFHDVQPDPAAMTTVFEADPLSGTYKVRDDGTIALQGVGPVQISGMSAFAASERIVDLLGGYRPSDGAEVRVETGSIPATFAVFAVGLLAGALVNIGYAAYLLTRNHSWNLLARSPRELLLAIIIGVNFSLAAALMGKGMLMLGALGASIGWGIQQAMQMTGNQLLGFLSGEWKGVKGKPLRQMYLAIAIFIVAASLMTYGNTLAKN